MTRAELREAVADVLLDALLAGDKGPEDMADAALAVALPVLREHFAGVAEANTDNVTGTAYAIAAAIRADEGPP